MSNDFQESSRSNYRAKRKKTNIILNGLIVVVLILIVFVAYSIFISGDNNTAPKKEVQTTAEKTSAAKHSAHSINKDKTSAKESSANKQSSEDTQGDQGSPSTTEGNNTSSDQTQTVNSPDANTAVPASTGQPHATSYDTNSSDWQQMLQAISSATGLDQGNMTVWFLGSDKSTPNGSVGTVSAKGNKQQKYRVYLQWVDGQGWKTTKVEQVAQ